VSIKGSEPEEFSGLGQIDIDWKGNAMEFRDSATIEAWKRRLGHDPHIFAAFISASSRGIKLLIRLTLSTAPYRSLMAAAREYILHAYGLSPDPIDDVQRLCFVSYDPDLIINEAAVPLPYSAPSESNGEKADHADTDGLDYLSFKTAKKDKDALEIFKKDLGTFVRFYEFMSQIVDYDDPNLEKLSLYARNLNPLLREQVTDDDDVDLNHVVLSHYRLSKIRQQDLALSDNDQSSYGLKPGEGLGTAKARDRKEEFLSQIIARLNELFITDNLTEQDLVNYAYTVRDKVRENDKVMSQLANNTAEQALLGDFPKAVDDAILDSSEAHENQKMQLLADPKKAAAFAKLVFDLLRAAS
jgi:hypothetical protein